MARLRQGKDGVTASSKSQSASKDSKKSKSGKNDKVLKEHILAMGGDQEDFDLLKNVGDASGSGVSTADPSLSKDVSKFLKDLNLGGGVLPAAEKKKGKAKEGTTIKAPKPRLAPPLKEPTPPPVEEPKEVPKVQLPSKITFNPKSPFIFQPTSQWYMAVQPLDPGYASTSTITPSQLSSLTTRAAEMHEKDIRTFQTSSSSNSSSSEANFLSKIIQSGTLSDRLSALTLLVQSSPLHNIKALENLKMMAERGKGKGGREESLKALRCVVDWWVGGGAPNRKLNLYNIPP
ncbi:hypothetical protein BDQ12DRAFT_264759 [Crucibulum laeve]|uniref:Uncharacterized protein n=1 Tax=Crucibulum laeve TaxID=68775 RepID=A0A5C3LSB3_9AGAR|nr:hypothetical protein BDQ12DRAFT_264759 [Crucibulum laeve]